MRQTSRVIRANQCVRRKGSFTKQLAQEPGSWGKSTRERRCERHPARLDVAARKEALHLLASQRSIVRVDSTGGPEVVHKHCTGRAEHSEHLACYVLTDR